jgi:AcrR family transcriptional regulator
MSACAIAQTPEASAAAQLSPLQTQAAVAPSHGATISGAAGAISVHRSTIYNWFKNEPLFRATVTELQRERHQRVLDEMRELESLALDTLREILQNDAAPAGVRLRAALSILNRPKNCYGNDEWHLPVLEDVAHSLKRDPLLAVVPEFDEIQQNSTSADAAEPVVTVPALESVEPAPRHTEQDVAPAVNSPIDTIRHSSSFEPDFLAPFEQKLQQKQVPLPPPIPLFPGPQMQGQRC